MVLAGPALLLAAGLAMAQGRPDFSGRWTAVPPSSPAAGDRGASGAAAAGTMGSGWGATLTIEQNASTLVVERAQFSQYDMQPPLRLTYTLDGAESRNTINMGRGPQALVSKAAWQGSSLVITTSFRFSNPRTGTAEASDLTQVLSLDTSGSLVVTTTLGAALGGEASTTSTVYKKGP
jgi:hypothetical protein